MGYHAEGMCLTEGCSVLDALEEYADCLQNLKLNRDGWILAQVLYKEGVHALLQEESRRAVGNGPSPEASTRLQLS
jgi:hypothetical protein